MHNPKEHSLVKVFGGGNTAYGQNYGQWGHGDSASELFEPVRMESSRNTPDLQRAR
ncbi:hypothetical protein [Paenibacillus sp. YIM B09110]|uniref:hypothetical protein n=1 Tax=Paenibacillus sp. YIM B09110 TaxID=3126102 RepID=UPI00301D334C